MLRAVSSGATTPVPVAPVPQERPNDPALDAYKGGFSVSRGWAADVRMWGGSKLPAAATLSQRQSTCHAQAVQALQTAGLRRLGSSSLFDLPAQSARTWDATCVSAPLTARVLPNGGLQFYANPPADGPQVASFADIQVQPQDHWVEITGIPDVRQQRTGRWHICGGHHLDEAVMDCGYRDPTDLTPRRDFEAHLFEQGFKAEEEGVYRWKKKQECLLYVQEHRPNRLLVPVKLTSQSLWLDRVDTKRASNSQTWEFHMTDGACNERVLTIKSDETGRRDFKFQSIKHPLRVPRAVRNVGRNVWEFLSRGKKATDRA